jgi:hypothetical protein
MKSSMDHGVFHPSHMDKQTSRSSQKEIESGFVNPASPLQTKDPRFAITMLQEYYTTL